MDSTMSATSNASFDLDRDMGSGDITLTVTGDDDTIKINFGRFFSDADMLADDLEELAKEGRRLADDWEDLPDFETDGFVGDGRDGYDVSLEGQNKGTYPSRDIAVYELAKVMTADGVFPNCWYQNERGNTDSIAEDVSKHYAEGDAGVLPLAGAVWESGDMLTSDSADWPMVVDCDYGELGIWSHAYGDPSITQLIDHSDRDNWHVAED